jgi:hypothetical protein
MQQQICNAVITIACENLSILKIDRNAFVNTAVFFIQNMFNRQKNWYLSFNHYTKYQNTCMLCNLLECK